MPKRKSGLPYSSHDISKEQDIETKKLLQVMNIAKNYNITDEQFSNLIQKLIAKSDRDSISKLMENPEYESMKEQEYIDSWVDKNEQNRYFADPNKDDFEKITRSGGTAGNGRYYPEDSLFVEMLRTGNWSGKYKDIPSSELDSRHKDNITDKYFNAKYWQKYSK